ncbi:MAG TPA: bifunctional glutamate N-acetyltransferase/amino-acid acetyltransferase ArgJ [Candidatus Acidoferrales bacterium]|nr:bifunctional glutamate N-acetyltransferase/amino-acid acetyltransferase ArgJ [Candidatus Acidoferrales bacterium]
MSETLSLPRGFRFGAMSCGIKRSGAPDLALVVADELVSVAAAFTSNRVQAAPVLVSKEHVRRSGGRMRAVVMNSGNANCCTGKAGLAAARSMAEGLAAKLFCRRDQVFICSTGVIGVPLPVEKILAGIPRLLPDIAAGPEAFARLSRGILTTDTRPKTASASVRIGGRTARIAGCTKGAGMIAPQFQGAHATMLAFIFTDVAASPVLLRQALDAVVGPTFNSITVDGDTSTNDTVALFAGGASGATLASPRSQDFARFVRALERVCHSLALQIVADGEGARHVIEIDVRGAPDDRAAETVARTIAHSPLVKTALAGADPNWGRILAAAGRSGVVFRPERASITLAGVPVFRRGHPLPFDEKAAHEGMNQSQYVMLVDLKAGRGRARIWTCELSEGYVRINADYRT